MELQMLLDVPDMPINPSHWVYNEIDCDGMLHSSCNDFCDWKISKDIEYISDEEKATSDRSLSSTPSDVSSRLNHHDLGLSFEVDYLTEQHTLQSPSPRDMSPTLGLQLPSSRLNLKLDLNNVASTWSRLSPGQSSIFTIPKDNIKASLAQFPPMSARTASISVDTIPEYTNLFNKSHPIDQHTTSIHATSTTVRPQAAIPSFIPSAATLLPITKKTLSTQPRLLASSASRPGHASKKSAHRRARSGKSTDKRPRIKGRFVKREEFDRMVAEQSTETQEEVIDHCQNAAQDAATVPESDCIDACDAAENDIGILREEEEEDDAFDAMMMGMDDEDDLLQCCPSLTESATTSTC